MKYIAAKQYSYTPFFRNSILYYNRVSVSIDIKVFSEAGICSVVCKLVAGVCCTLRYANQLGALIERLCIRIERG